MWYQRLNLVLLSLVSQSLFSEVWLSSLIDAQFFSSALLFVACTGTLCLGHVPSWKQIIQDSDLFACLPCFSGSSPFLNLEFIFSLPF